MSPIIHINTNIFLCVLSHPIFDMSFVLCNTAHNTGSNLSNCKIQYVMTTSLKTCIVNEDKVETIHSYQIISTFYKITPTLLSECQYTLLKVYLRKHSTTRKIGEDLFVACVSATCWLHCRSSSLLTASSGPRY